MPSVHLLRVGALVALLVLTGASLVGALPLAPPRAAGDPAGPPVSPTGDVGFATLDGGDAVTGSSEDGERGPLIDPNG